MQNTKVWKLMGSAAILAVAAAGLMAVSAQTAWAQEVDRANVGDSPENPGPLATDVSPAMTHAAIRHAAVKVAEWQLAQSETKFNQQWTFAALYDGFLAASKLTGDAKYHDAMVKMGAKFDWKLLNKRFPHADDMAIGQTYMDLALADHKPNYALDVKANMDTLLVRP